MLVEALIHNTKITAFCDDITRQEVDAIVNPTAANLLSSDPVDLMIRKAGGMGFLKECRHYAARHGSIPVGEAAVTGAGRLAARFVIHAVAPKWSGGLRQEEKLLRQLYWNILCRADEAGASSVAIPAVGAGQGIPISIVAKVALSTVSDFLLKDRSIREIRFVLLSKYDVAEYERIWDTISYSANLPKRSVSGRYA